jgi:hypothetical protein
MADKPIKKKKKIKNKEFAKTQKEIGESAGEIARSVLLKQCESAGITIPTVLKEIASCLSAEEQKVTYSPTEGDWQYSKKMKAWTVRQKAIDQIIAIMGIKAPEKQDLKLSSSGPVTFKVEFDDKPIDDDRDKD